MRGGFCLCCFRAVPDTLILSKLRVAAAAETLIPPSCLQAAIVAVVPNGTEHSEENVSVSDKFNLHGEAIAHQISELSFQNRYQKKKKK